MIIHKKVSYTIGNGLFQLIRVHPHGREVIKSSGVIFQNLIIVTREITNKIYNLSEGDFNE